MNREEQIAAARRIAEDNPENWAIGHGRMLPTSLYHASGAEVHFCLDLWYAWDAKGKALKNARGRARWFRSPAAAIRALGFTINVREDTCAN